MPTLCVFQSIAAISCSLLLVSGTGKQNISEIDFQAYLNSIYPGCSGENEHDVGIGAIDYWDVNHDSKPEAVIVASTCATGTAGPDVHSVFKLLPNGQLIELPFAEETASSRQQLFNTLTGNRNYWFKFEKGYLVEDWWDASEKDHPLKRYFKWNGNMFILVKVKVGFSAP